MQNMHNGCGNESVKFKACYQHVNIFCAQMACFHLSLDAKITYVIMFSRLCQFSLQRHNKSYKTAAD